MYDDIGPDTDPRYGTDAQKLQEEFYQKDGGPMPLLEMTYINKTQPKPCDKEVWLYELKEEKLSELDRPLQGILRNCHDSKCTR